MKKSTGVINFGQRLYAPFTVRIFDSRNTCYDALQTFSDEREAKLFTKMSSVPFKAVLQDANGNWMEYQKGTVVSWSTDLGTDKIPS